MLKAGPKIYLWGWYGHENSGDDALLTEMCLMLSKISGNVRVIVQISGEGRLPELPEFVQVHRLVQWFKGSIYLNKIITILRSNALVFGGGSTMADVNPARMKGLRQKYHICRLAKLKGIPIVFSALGLGPLVSEEGAKIAKRTLDLADVVEVRDGASYELCKKIGVSSEVIQAFDPSVLMPEQFSIDLPQLAKSGPTSVGISLAKSSGTVDNSDASQEAKISNLVSAIKKVAAVKPLRVAPIEMCGDKIDGERQLCQRLMDELKDVCEVELIPYDPDPAKMLQRLSALDLIIAERLHAALYAYTLGINFAVVPYHSKCTALADDVKLPDVCRLAPEMPQEQIVRLLECCMAASEQCKPTLSLEKARKLSQTGQNAVVQKLQTLLGAAL